MVLLGLVQAVVAMKPCILIRSCLDTDHETEIASQYLPVFQYRTEIPHDSLVVGRYSVLPYYKELESELLLGGSRLVNTHREHSFIANVLEWGADDPDSCLYGLTPKSWGSWYQLPDGAYVVKGATNSRKTQWNTRMFAPNKASISGIVNRLLDDVLIADQGIVVREFVPLKVMEVGLNDQPITNEWRTFWLRTVQGPVMLAKGYYWGSYPELASLAQWDHKAEALVNEAAQRVAQEATFFVLDVAETATGDWIVIEINDGQMSGLSLCDPHELYSNLAKQVQLM